MRGLLDRLGIGAGLLVWIAIWEFAGRFANTRLLPPFTEVVAAIPALVADPGFRDGALQSLAALAIGLALAIGCGVPVGILMARSPTFDRAAGVWVDIFLATPLTALVPALMAIFGFGTATVVATVVLFSVWIVILDTRAGVKQIRPSLADMARAFGARRRDIILRITLPAALPEILVGLRLAVIAGVKGVVVGQILISVFGIGRLLTIYSQNFLMERFWALMIVVLGFSYALVLAIQLLERKVAHYAPRR
jgi:NitT/TauT family transport system permease protein